MPSPVDNVLKSRTVRQLIGSSSSAFRAASMASRAALRSLRARSSASHRSTLALLGFATRAASDDRQTPEIVSVCIIFLSAGASSPGSAGHSRSRSRRQTGSAKVAVCFERHDSINKSRAEQASANAGIVWSAFDSVGGESTTVASSVGVSGRLLHGDVHGLPAPDASSCLPPLVVKLVSEASCVRFLSSSAIRDYYLCHW